MQSTRGTTTGVEDLHRALRPRLEAVARRVVRDHDEASDVVSEAFTRWWQQGPRPDDDAVRWLFVVTRNLALNRARDLARRPVVDGEALCRHVAVDPIEPATDPRRLDLLRRAFSGLGERDALALRLRYLDGFEVAEVARALGTTPAHTRVLVHRARARLRTEAIALLADHHDAGESCRRALLGAPGNRSEGHASCRSCQVVTDELVALATSAAIPLLPVAGVGARLAAWSTPLSRVSDGAANGWARVVEAVAALVVVTAVGTPAAAPPLVAVGPATAPSSVAGRPDPAARSAGTSGAAALAVARSGELAVAGSQLVGGPLVVADPGADRQEHVAHQLTGGALRRLGDDLLLPDVIDDAFDPAGDIRILTISTIAGDDGEPEAVRFAVDLGLDPSPRFYYGVSFTIDDHQPTFDRPDNFVDWWFGSANLNWVNGEPDATFQLSSTAPHRWTHHDAIATTLRLVPGGFELDVAFDDIPWSWREHFRPGTLLTEIRAVVGHTDPGTNGYSDEAPDGGDGERYRIGEAHQDGT